jgi:hypothetical protein
LGLLVPAAPILEPLGRGQGRNRRDAETEAAAPGPARNALAAAFPLFHGAVATERRALVAAVSRKGTIGAASVPAGRAEVPEAARRALALGLPVAWEDLEAESWRLAEGPR